MGWGMKKILGLKKYMMVYKVCNFNNVKYNKK